MRLRDRIFKRLPVWAKRLYALKVVVKPMYRWVRTGTGTFTFFVIGPKYFTCEQDESGVGRYDLNQDWTTSVVGAQTGEIPKPEKSKTVVAPDEEGEIINEVLDDYFDAKASNWSLGLDDFLSGPKGPAS
jgi:hypothetical protein